MYRIIDASLSLYKLLSEYVVTIRTTINPINRSKVITYSSVRQNNSCKNSKQVQQVNMSTDRTTNPTYGIDFTELDCEKIVRKELKIKDSANKKYKYAHIIIGYQATSGKPWNLVQKLPDGIRGKLKMKVGDDGFTKKHTVTLMHDFDDADNGQMHEIHVQKLWEEWKRLKVIIAEALVDMADDPKYAFLGLDIMKAKLEKKGKWNVDGVLKKIESNDIKVLDPVFQLSVEKEDGSRVPVENAERRLAMRLKVTRPEDMKEEWQSLASKYFHPRAKSAEKAEPIDVNDMVDLSHTGKYRIKIPHIYISKDGNFPQIAVQIYVTSCFDTRIVESTTLDSAVQDEADNAVVSDEEHSQLMDIFKRKNKERREKENAEKAPSAAERVIGDDE